MRQYFNRKELSNEAYHKRPELSSSALKQFSKCPHYYHQHWPLDKRKPPTPAMEFGTLIHTLCLEPDEFEQWAIIDGTRASKAYKDAEGPKVPMADFNHANRLADAFYENEDIALLMEQAESPATYALNPGL